MKKKSTNNSWTKLAQYDPREVGRKSNSEIATQNWTAFKSEWTGKVMDTLDFKELDHLQSDSYIKLLWNLILPHETEIRCYYVEIYLISTLESLKLIVCPH